MLRIEYLYWLLGLFLAAAAILNLRDRRYASAGFWAVLAVPFVLGDAILGALESGSGWPAQAMGAGVLALGVLATRTRPRQAPDGAAEVAQRERSAQRFGNRLFLPALAIPLLTLALFLLGKHASWNGRSLLDADALTLTSLGIASELALGAALRLTRAPFTEGIGEGRRLLDAVGWAALLPMVLATLGGVFAATGVGDTIAALTGMLIPVGSAFACLVAFALGMVVFTVVMGNAFAAFPVMMAGIGLPLLIHGHGANAAVLGAIGMLTGYCGTLLTPMAANFNIVPVALLELPGQYDVIRAQWPVAIALLAINFALLWWLAL
jgi:uncharacterized membrane protein